MKTLAFFSVASKLFLLLFFTRNSSSVRHARNLVWTQTPHLKLGVSRIVGIEGDPSEWVPSGNVQVRHISAPHVGWQFKALAFNYGTQTLYWTEATNKKIQGLRLNGTTETETIFTGTSNMAEGLAVDWISNNIYWTDSLYNWVIMAPLGPSVEHVYKLVVKPSSDDPSKPHSLAIHPSKGYLFWTDISYFASIKVCDLLGENQRAIVNSDMLDPRGITIDYQEDRLYWVDRKKDTIESALLNGNDRRVVAFQSGTIFFGIAVYQNYLFVTEQRQGHLRVYDKMTGNNEINYQLGYIPDGIVMYDEDLQLGNSSACEAAGCQQFCIHDPLAGPICRCGEGYTLKPDGVSCKGSKRFITPSHIYSIRDAICQYPANLPDMSLYNISLESQCFLQQGRGHYGLAFDAREHVLFYSEGVTKSISRVNLEVDAVGENIIKGVGDVQGMALDWVHDNLFWTDRTYNHISLARKDGRYPVVVIDGLDEPLGIAVHPAKGKIFWSEHGSTQMISMASMDGSNLTPVINSSAVEMPNHLFLDTVNDKLYWADSGLHAIKSWEMTTNTITTVFESAGVTFFGVSMFQDYVLWTDRDDMKNGIHAARLDKLEKVRGILHPQAGMASALITFDIQNQPASKGACSVNNGGCEHICKPTSNETFICACGTGYTLDRNLKKCSSDVKTDDFVLTVDSYQKQIYQVELGSGKVNAIPLSGLYKGVALDYHPISQTIYWTDNKEGVIMSSNLDGFGESVFRKLPNDSVSDGIAVDSVNQLLFYTCTNYDVIVAVSLYNPIFYKTIINESLDEPRDIIVHPEAGKIYWTDWGEEPKIEVATMDGGNRSVVLKLANDSWPNAIALDPSQMNLFWVDAKADIIGRINLDTGVKKVLHSEPKSHFFGLAILDNYLYITDWFQKHVRRMSCDGGHMEQIGPAKFARLNGITAFKKSIVRPVFGSCMLSGCSNLCLPVSAHEYKCACADDKAPGGFLCTDNADDNIILSPDSHKKNKEEESPAVAIGMSVLGVVAVLIIAVAAIFIYNKRCRNASIPHDKLVEDTSRVDTFYRITFPDPGKDDSNFDSGIDNPSFNCSTEDMTMSGNLVRYSPM